MNLSRDDHYKTLFLKAIFVTHFTNGENTTPLMNLRNKPPDIPFGTILTYTVSFKTILVRHFTKWHFIIFLGLQTPLVPYPQTLMAYPTLG